MKFAIKLPEPLTSPKTPVFGQLERYSSDLVDSSVCEADDEEDFGQLDW
jgi:hypothetical protein